MVSSDTEVTASRVKIFDQTPKKHKLNSTSPFYDAQNVHGHPIPTPHEKKNSRGEAGV